jgi:hypothetical protein
MGLFCRGILLALVSILLLCKMAFANAIDPVSAAATDAWTLFRTTIPGHFQNWIVAGNGPKYVLIYSEPPPALSRDDYLQLFQRTFRGLKAASIKTRQLGYNGSVSDIILEIDYGSTGLVPLGKLNEDIAALSQVIYGTTAGARAIPLAELISSPPTKAAPASLSISGEELRNWLFGPQSNLLFVSPEHGAPMPASRIATEGGPGRYISVDNALVLLALDANKELTRADVAQIRLFTLDSDLILGGVIDDTVKLVMVVARARQIPLIDLPPLRVEDILNIVVTRDELLAQSYDRTFPGAGRIEGTDGTPWDWAPSYLSADLIDTEFGSLLNEGDAILKSQSMSNAIEYNGYTIFQLPDPPYLEGVFAHLQLISSIDSLIFNFNTKGSGHWFIDSDHRRIFATNRTGSFTVTYSPSASGALSSQQSFAGVSEAEEKYTAWFDQSQDETLTRTVQYMNIYQIFKGTHISGMRPYGDRQEAFARRGDVLKAAVKKQLSDCIDHIDHSDADLLKRFSALYTQAGRQAGLSLNALIPPASRQDLIGRASQAAIAVRYDGNLQAASIENIELRIEQFESQREKLLKSFEIDFSEAKRMKAHIDEIYGRYQTTDDTKDGDLFTYYRMPEGELSRRFANVDKPAYEKMGNRVNSESTALSGLENQIQKLIDDRDRVYSAKSGDRLLLDVMNDLCMVSNPSSTV